MSIIYTIGHSTHTIDEFIHILKSYGIQKIVDIRTIPKSRHNPQFNQDELKKSLHNHHIGYEHMQSLGGLRHTTKDSINTAWQNLSFRGFADYMQTKNFEEGLKLLICMAQEKRIAIMCAESVPWRCHRSLIGDALMVRHMTVIDILSATSKRQHTITPWAHVQGYTIIYPGKKV